MSAPNFSYQRRCILVSNDDFAANNVPDHTENFDHDRSYPSFILDKFRNDFSTVAIVLTYGYYEDACLDIVDDDSLVSELSCSDYHFAGLTRDELYNELSYYFCGNISRRMFNRHMKGLHRYSEDYQSELSYKIDDIFEEVRDIELRKAERTLEKLRKAYGYKELVCTARFSNGEAWYDYKR